MTELQRIIEKGASGTSLTKKELAVITQAIRDLDLQGFGGVCGEAAIRINQKIFSSRGFYFAGVNKFLFRQHDEFLGHVVVKFAKKYWDAQGVLGSKHNVLSWGMLEEGDPDYDDYNMKSDDYEETELVELSEIDIRYHLPASV